MTAYIKQVTVTREGSVLNSTADFTFPGFGPVKGAMVTAIVASGIPTGLQAAQNMSMGYWTPTVQRCVAIGVVNGVNVSGTTDLYSRGSDRTKTAIVVDRTGYNSRWEGSAITDGLRLTCTELNTDRAIIFQVVLFGGDELDCSVAGFSGNSNTTHNFGLRPRLILTCGVSDTTDTVKTDHASFFSGAASWENNANGGLRNTSICYQNDQSSTNRTISYACELWDNSVNFCNQQNTGAGVIQGRAAYNTQSATGASYAVTQGNAIGNFIAMAVSYPDRCNLLSNHIFAQTVDPAVINSPIGYTGAASGIYAHWAFEGVNVNSLNAGAGFSVIQGDNGGMYKQVGMQTRDNTTSTICRTFQNDTGLRSYRAGTVASGVWGPIQYDTDGFTRWVVTTAPTQNGWGWALSWEGFDEPTGGLLNIFYGADEIAEISYGGTPISEVYYGATKVFG